MFYLVHVWVEGLNYSVSFSIKQLDCFKIHMNCEKDYYFYCYDFFINHNSMIRLKKNKPQRVHNTTLNSYTLTFEVWLFDSTSITVLPELIL